MAQAGVVNGKAALHDLRLHHADSRRAYLPSALRLTLTQCIDVVVNEPLKGIEALRAGGVHEGDTRG